MNTTPYKGSKVVVLEAAEHKYVHVYEVDGDYIRIDKSGFLGIKEGQKLARNNEGKLSLPVSLEDYYFHASGWNFIHGNAKYIELGVYDRADESLPTIYPNCSGTK